MELSLPYLNELATQIIFISAFLGGFSAAILGTLIVSKHHGRILKALILGASFSATTFIVAVFSMTKLSMMTTPGYPFPVTKADTMLPQATGIIAFLLGIIALMVVVGMSGWLQSKRLGIATSIIAALGLFCVMLSF